MLWLLLCLLAISCGDSKRLAVHPREKNRRPLEIKTSLKDSSEPDDVHKRSKRGYYDHDEDWDNKINITKSILTGDRHGTAYVEWGGTKKKSDVIIILTKDSSPVPTDSTLYISTDYGKNFNIKKIMVGNNAAVFNYIYQSLSNHQQFMLNDIVNKAVAVSEDEGRTWQVYATDFTPSIIDHHPTIQNLLLAHDLPKRKLYVSQNFGKTFTAIRPDLNVVDFYWGTTSYDQDNTAFLVADNGDGTQAIYTSDDFFKSDTTIIDSAANQFAVIDEFYFYVKNSTHKDHGLNDLDLFISFDRSHPVKANFPPDLAEFATTEFYIADAGFGQVFVIASHLENMTNLYVSEHKTGNMVLSLERILFANKATYNTISWMDGIEPFADFQAIEGLPGVFIASQLDIGRVGHRPIHTVMTYNKGGTWQSVQPPKYDRDGDPTECFLPECALHISLMFGSNLPNAKHTPLLTRENAPGLIIASGNLGYSHSMINDLFMSTDGGVEWEEVLGGQYHYQILDHGGLVVAVRRGQLTDSLMFTHDEGGTWYKKQISTTNNVTVYGLITEPGEITSVINVYAMEENGMEWVIFTIDFKEFLGDKCRSSDFTYWSIRDELKSTECVMGKDTRYERKRPSSHCYIGPEYNRTLSEKPCPCQASDFECDFLYSRENAGDPCVMMEGVSEDWFIPDSCSPGQTYDRSMGYLKIEGDKCAGGEESLFSYRKAKCPDTNLTLSISMSAKNKAVQRGTPVVFTATSDDYLDDVYFLWYINDNSTFSGIGSNGMTFKHTFDKAGAYVVSLTANNGAGPVVAMDMIQVDDPITSLKLQYEPVDPAVGEGMIFIITSDDNSVSTDVSRLSYHWSVGTDSYLPLLLTSFETAGRKTVTVTVSNSLGSKNFTASFVVNDLTVTNVKAIPVSSNSIQVVWDPPVLRPGVVDTYTLKYRSDIETTWTMVRIGGGNTTQTNYQANNLEDDTLYDFIVLTISPGGASSEASEVVSVKTLPLNSLNPATALTVVPSGKKAKVSWKAPPGKSSPTSYVVQYWMSDRFNEIKSQSTSSTSVTSTTLNGLIPGASYTLRVLTHYSNQDSYSDPTHFQVEGSEIGDLQEVRGYPVNSTTVVIVWDRPAVAVDGFHIYNSTTNRVVTTVVEDTAEISGLLPYTSYSFQVQPYTRNDVGKKSDPVVIRTDVGVPDPVGQLDCMQKNGLPVLTWQKPKRTNGPISKYLIKYYDDSLLDKGIAPFVSSETFSLTLPQLELYKEFKFSVTAQGLDYTSESAFTTCVSESSAGTPGQVREVYLKEPHLASLDLMWRPPPLAQGAITYEIRYYIADGDTKIGMEHVATTSDTSITLSEGISPSTEYGITITAKNKNGLGPPSSPVTKAVTLTPPIGSLEYEFKFKTSDFNKNTFVNFANALKEEIVQVTKVSRHRLVGVGITHSDTSDTKVAVWITPRDTPDDTKEPSSEAVIAALDSKIKKSEFVVGLAKATSGGVDHIAANKGSHHDVAEIVIPGICGLLVVVLVAGLLYYRNRYQQVLRRYSFRSRYANDDNDDVNMIECADEGEAITSSDLGRGALAISSEGSSQRPRGIKNFFERFNYTQVDQNDPDELIDDDEEHLLPL